MTLVLVDTFGFFFRSFFALPPLKSKSGFPTGLLTGFLNFVSKLTKEEPDVLALFCLEGRGRGFREEIYSDYKGTRPDAPEEFKLQLPIAIEWLEKMGFSTLSVDGFEADDIIATLCAQAKAQGFKVKIISHDKDLYQLIDDGRIVVWDPSKKIEVDENACMERFGVHPSDMIEFQALVGDSVDNVPGVKGVGPKTAAKLIEQFGTLQGVYDNIDKVAGDKLRQNLIEHREQAFMSRELVRLRHDIAIDRPIDSFTTPRGNPFEAIREEMLSYDIRHLLGREKLLDSPKPQPPKPAAAAFEAVLLDSTEKLFETISKITDDMPVALDTETDSLDTKKAKLVGFSFAFEPHRGYYVPVAHSYLGVGDQLSWEDASKALRELLSKRVLGHNLKFDLGLLYRLLECEPIAPLCDTMLLAWLLDPGSLVALDAVSRRYLGHETIKFKSTVKEGENFASVMIEDACRYAAEDAWVSLRLYHTLLQAAKDKQFDKIEQIMQTVELPFIALLIKMEHYGIKVSQERLKHLQKECESEIGKLQERIFELAGQQFNLNSTQQLSNILFEKLGLQGGKKTKTGLSTDEATLGKLSDEHEIIPMILDYRELFKLKSTYIEPLSRYAASDEYSRVYTSFLQTGTATGRLSSKNPNLQNIPARTPLGRRIRGAFTAKEGHRLIGLDYSQIELRLLAHFSQDSTLIKAFEHDEDIHLQTAVKIFGESSAKEHRSAAKTINFGLLYGMGAQKLSATLNIPQKEAKALIESYFAAFPTVKNYLESIRVQAKQQGYVETLLGRRRYFDFSSANARDEATYLREAVNTVFQGSAADLIKMAMLKIDVMITKQNLPAKIVLQIHDELIFEAETAAAEELSKKLEDAMEGIVSLRVPLRTSRAIGQTWEELK